MRTEVDADGSCISNCWCSDKMSFFTSRASIERKYFALKVSLADACLVAGAMVIGFTLHRLNFAIVENEKRRHQQINEKKRDDAKVEKTSSKEGFPRDAVENVCKNALNIDFVKWQDNNGVFGREEECCVKHRHAMMLKQKERQIEIALAKHSDTFFKARKEAKRDIGYARGRGIGLAGYMGEHGERYRVPIMYFGNRKVYPNPLAVKVYLDGPLSVDYFVIDASRRKHSEVDEIVVLPRRTLEECEKFEDPLDVLCLSAREEPWTFRSDMDVLEKFYKLEKVAEQAYFYWFKDRSGEDSE